MNREYIYVWNPSYNDSNYSGDDRPVPIFVNSHDQLNKGIGLMFDHIGPSMLAIV